MNQDHSCVLCDSTDAHLYYSNENSSYLRCSTCELVFSPKRFHLNNTDEKSRYDLHQNNPEDEHYRAFLSRVFNPVLDCIKPGAKGLDFGCGPGPTLSLMFEEKGYSVDLFDKYYANNPDIFNNQYDFITATEVAEHLDEPGKELSRLFKLLNPGGVLAVMTSMLSQEIVFSSWHYKDDSTHICFFSKKTMNHLAKKWNAQIKFYDKDVVLFFK